MPTNADRRPTARVLFPFRAAAATLVLALGAAAGCGPGAEDATTAGLATEPERVESPGLGIALSGARAAGFEVVTNEGETLVLVRPAQDEQAEAELTYEVGPPQTAGVNLVEAVNQQKAEIDSRPDGHFLGQVELMSQFGTAFSTRGRYAGGDGGEMEEIRIFTVHPGGDRMMSITYRYAPNAGATKERLDQAMAALGLVEPLPTPDASGGEGATPPPAPGEDAGGEAAEVG